MVMFPAYRLTSGPASAVAATVMMSSEITPRVKIRSAYASPRSGSSLAARTSIGTTTEVKMPPSMRKYTVFGSVLELLYASASPAVPSAATSTNVRRNPVARDATVPSAITWLDLARFGWVTIACGPVPRSAPDGGTWRTRVPCSGPSGGCRRSCPAGRGSGCSGASG
jgi:hypothetical protein